MIRMFGQFSAFETPMVLNLSKSVVVGEHHISIHAGGGVGGLLRQILID